MTASREPEYAKVTIESKHRMIVIGKVDIRALELRAVDSDASDDEPYRVPFVHMRVKRIWAYELTLVGEIPPDDDGNFVRIERPSDRDLTPPPQGV